MYRIYLLILFFQMICSGLAAQFSNNWLLNDNHYYDSRKSCSDTFRTPHILNFNSSPPKILKLDTTIILQRYFAFTLSDKKGHLKYLASNPHLIPRNFDSTLKEKYYYYWNLEGKHFSLPVELRYLYYRDTTKDASYPNTLILNNSIEEKSLLWGIKAVGFPNQRVFYNAVWGSLEDSTRINSFLKMGLDGDSAFVEEIDTTNLSYLTNLLRSPLRNIILRRGNYFYTLDLPRYFKWQALVLRKYDHEGVLQYEKPLKLPDDALNQIPYNNLTLNCIPGNTGRYFALQYKSPGDTAFLEMLVMEMDEDENIQVRQKIVNRHYWPRSLLFEYGQTACLSANDSFLFLKIPPFSSSYSRKDSAKAQHLLRYSLFANDSLPEVISLPDFDREVVRMALGPNGKIYFNHYANRELPIGLGVINFPEESKIEDIGVEPFFLEKINHDFNDYCNLKRPMTYYEPNVYVGQELLRFKAVQDSCGATEVLCYNYSDPSFQKFEWELMTVDSLIIEKQTAKTGRLHPPHTGLYYIRLKGTDMNGRVAWRWQKLRYKQSISAKIITQLPKFICRYNSLALEGEFLADTNYQARYTWQIIRDNIIIKTIDAQKADYKFTNLGLYDLRLIYHNGFCTDTHTVTKAVRVINAPEPGMYLSSDTLCTGENLTVYDISKGFIQTATYRWSDGMVHEDTKNLKRSFTEPGSYQLLQRLKGSTHCISQDSVRVWVQRGIHPDSVAVIQSASVQDSKTVALTWSKMEGMAAYRIINTNNGNTYLFDSENITNFIDSQNTIIDTTLGYQMFVQDSCGKWSKWSREVQTIYLKGTNQNNEYILLNWTAYKGFLNGVKTYHIERSTTDGVWENIGQTTELIWQDNSINKLNGNYLKYRIKAISSEQKSYESLSQEVLIDTKETLFIPNAFTPNGDGVNDVFRVGTFGISSFECRIYGRNGQIMAYSNNPENIWDGSNKYGTIYMNGSYLYQIEATTSKGEKIIRNGILLLIN